MEKERQATDTIKRLQTEISMKDVRIADLEDEVREGQDTVNRSLSYSAREYDLIRQLEKMKVQNEMQAQLIRQMSRGDPRLS